ncbi:hypothetical protein AURDEDRAFT_161454 [Auricularia subglabra TFB-10046 SS5]|nr:hypothetical protein AURDEDRAFT_161454 [Auricularia subglabra TFB-10046 SS5]
MGGYQSSGRTPTVGPLGSSLRQSLADLFRQRPELSNPTSGPLRGDPSMGGVWTMRESLKAAAPDGLPGVLGLVQQIELAKSFSNLSIRPRVTSSWRRTSGTLRIALFGW